MDKHRRSRQVRYRKRTVSPQNVRKARRRLLAALLTVVMLWAFLGFIRSDFFRIEQLVIQGNTYTGETEIRQAIPVTEGDNIWQLNTSLLEDKLAVIPRIESASVSRKLPRTLRVDIREKRVFALVPYKEYLFEMGYDGMALGTTQNPQKYGLPLLTGMAPVELSVGEMLLSGPALQDAIEAIEALDTSGVAVSELNLADEDNVVIVTMDGLTVWLGRNGYAVKADLLVQIMAQLQGRQGDGYLDLRVPAAPAFHVLATEKTQKNN